MSDLRGGIVLETQETRVRMGVRQTAKGNCQLDLTAEAPTVDEAGELLDKAIAKLIEKVHNHNLTLVNE